MIQLIVEILHLVVAGAMSFIGIEYSRAPECDPVRVEPAAYHQVVEASAGGEIFLLVPAASHAPQAVSDCGSTSAPVSLPRPRVRLQA